MKSNQDTENNDDMREEYDFSSMKGGVRGKYVSSFEKTAVAVVLDSDVAKVFPDSQSVNEALRTLMRVLRDKEKNAQQSV
jgi:hypothetical protein